MTRRFIRCIGYYGVALLTAFPDWAGPAPRRRCQFRAAAGQYPIHNGPLRIGCM